MDSATARGMTKFGLRCYSRNHKAVMLRIVAASMVECQGHGFRDCARNDEVWVPLLLLE